MTLLAAIYPTPLWVRLTFLVVVGIVIAGGVIGIVWALIWQRRRP
jgi:hypothetical protein